MVAHLDVGRAQSVKAIERAMLEDKKIFLSTQKDAVNDAPREKDIYTIGTYAEIKQVMKMPNGALRILVEGLERAEIASYNAGSEFASVDLNFISKPNYDKLEIEALVRSVSGYFEEYIKLNKKITGDNYLNVLDIEDPERLADGIGSTLILKIPKKQEIIQTFDIKERLALIATILVQEIEVLKTEKKIDYMVKKQIDKNQREYFLREQLKAIQEELGENNESLSEANEFKKKIDENKLPEEAKEKAYKEIAKLERMNPSFAEATNIRNYLEWLIELPWNRRTEDRIDIKKAETILNEDHYGLENVKERILEYLSVAKLNKTLKNPILCFVGPPGVGKTSLAKSIARALNRKFVRMSLGGVRDEAEIRGHRRTYVGAMPGRIIKGMKNADSSNPLFLLDEIDKMTTDFRGDPSSALLEVLDPEQNDTFSDHFIEVPFDLSRTFFVTTANNIFNVPKPLADRMEVIQLSSYTEEEKLQIAKQYLVPRQIKNNGLKENQFSISEGAIRKIIRNYTREAGVRNLEREIGSLCRKAAKLIAEKKRKKVVINETSIVKFLGIEKVRYGKKDEEALEGIANGLAWTEVGGDILQIEVTLLEGKGKLVLTGKLGEVMKESAQIAHSYIRSIAKDLGLEGDVFDKNDIHIHVPEGAIPKDGPSAGITICSALISCLINKSIDVSTAMTGELTLRGRVLAVGGIKEKVLAAHRAGYTRILLPAENEKNLEDIPANIKNKIEFIFVKHMKDVINIILGVKIK
ncbi:MAG: endopeptidase La [Clostridia bacterium]|nr:endopeptidase La [Clostridia bacterium]